MIIEQWSLICPMYRGLRDPEEGSEEPYGVVLEGLIYGHPLRSQGLHEFDDGRKWTTGLILGMPDFNTVEATDALYTLGEPDPYYERSFSFAHKRMWKAFGNDKDDGTDDWPTMAEYDIDENEIAVEEGDTQTNNEGKDDWDWHGYCSKDEDS